MTHLFDTDHISIFQRKAGAEFAALSAKVAAVGPAAVAYSVVSLHEQTVGCHAYINKARTPADVVRGYKMLGRVLDAFAEGPILLFDAVAAAEFQQFAGRLRIGVMDLRIAAIALSRGLILLTRNSGDFGQVPGLTTEDWTV